jgi:hypothetical protein
MKNPMLVSFSFSNNNANNATKERDLTSRKTRFFYFLSIKEKLTKYARFSDMKVFTSLDIVIKSNQKLRKPTIT